MPGHTRAGSPRKPARITGCPVKRSGNTRHAPARAGTRTARYWGDDFDDAGKHTVPRSKHGTMPVRSFPPNQFGLFEMLGHVLQWTKDCWNENYSAGLPADAAARTTGDCGRRVLRGGSWNDQQS